MSAMRGGAEQKEEFGAGWIATTTLHIEDGVGGAPILSGNGQHMRGKPLAIGSGRGDVQSSAAGLCMSIHHIAVRPASCRIALRARGKHLYMTARLCQGCSSIAPSSANVPWCCSLPPSPQWALYYPLIDLPIYQVWL